MISELRTTTTTTDYGADIPHNICSFLAFLLFRFRTETTTTRKNDTKYIKKLLHSYHTHPWPNLQ